MMRRKMRCGISVLLSLGMLCTAPACTGSVTADAAAGAQSAVADAAAGTRNAVADAAAGTRNAAADTAVGTQGAATGAAAGSGYGDVHADETTGYLYRPYGDGTGDAGRKVEIVGYVGAGNGASAEAGISPLAETDTAEGTDLVIPGTLDGNEVASIGKEAFKGNQTIKSVTISEGITSIGYSAFEDCTNVAKVSIPSTITEWAEESYDNNAFRSCTGLQELTLAEGLTVLGQNAFYGCTSLEQVRVPSTIETFNNRVFYDCTSLKEVELPEGIKQMGYQAFGNCALEEVAIPSTVESWESIRAMSVPIQVNDCSAFIGCRSLRKIVFAEGLKTLHRFSLGNLPLIKEIEVPGSVQNLTYAFRNAAALEKVVLKEGVTSLGSEAFNGCTGLKEIYFPSTLSSTEYACFKNVTAVEKVIFSPLGMPAAEDLTSTFSRLKEVYILSTSVGAYEEIRLTADTKLYCPQDSKTYQTYQKALAGSEHEGKLTALPSAGVVAGAYMAVYDGEEHDIATLSGIQEGDQVFYRLNGEKKLRGEMPRVKEAGKYGLNIYIMRAGEGGQLISAYSALSLQAEVKQAATPSPTPSPTPGGQATPAPGGQATPAPGGQATPTPKPPAGSQLQVGAAFTAGKFKYKVTNATAGKLAAAVSAPKSKTAKSAVVPATVKVNGAAYQVTSIGANAFKNCKKLKSVTIGKNVASIGKNAFSNAKALKKITIKTAKLKSVGKGAFKGIHKKAVIKVPKAVLKKYKKLLNGKGQKKTVKIKK